MSGANAFDAGSRSHNLLSVDLFVHHTSLFSCFKTTRRLVLLSTRIKFRPLQLYPFHIFYYGIQQSIRWP